MNKEREVDCYRFNVVSRISISHLATGRTVRDTKRGWTDQSAKNTPGRDLLWIYFSYNLQHIYPHTIVRNKRTKHRKHKFSHRRRLKKEIPHHARQNYMTDTPPDENFSYFNILGRRKRRVSASSIYRYLAAHKPLGRYIYDKKH